MAEFMKQARQNIRNNKSAYFVGLTVSACTALVLFARSCGGPGTVAGGPEGPAVAVRGDGICHEVESNPYQRDRNTGQIIRTDGGAPARNPLYSKEDCYYGDNVCDNQADQAQVRDPAGNPVQWDPALLVSSRADGGTQTPAIRYHSSRTVAFALEGETSLDCMLERVRREPCAAFTPGTSQVVQRPRFTFPLGTVDERTRQRTQDEIVAMHANPETLRTGGNYFTIYVGYQEECGDRSHPERNPPICTPESTAPCFCPNIAACAPPPPATCGNARADPGEACDFRDRRRPRGGCSEGNACSRRCQCVPVEQGERCGDNRRQGSEECDGTDSASCGEGAHCTSACQCEDNAPSGGGPVVGCSSEISRPISSAISGQVNRDPGTVRTAAGAQGGQAVSVAYSTRVDPPGVIAPPSVNLSCQGCRGGSFTVDMSRVVVSVSQPCTINGSFSLAGEQ
jgi:hypothetical protein